MQQLESKRDVSGTNKPASGTRRRSPKDRWSRAIDRSEKCSLPHVMSGDVCVSKER
jgi:hypothetical protein